MERLRPLLDAVARPTVALGLSRTDGEGSWPMRGWIGTTHVVVLPEDAPDEPVEIVALRRDRTARLLARLVDLSPRPRAETEAPLPSNGEAPGLRGMAAAVGVPADAPARRGQRRCGRAEADDIDRLAVLGVPGHGLWELTGEPLVLRPTTPWSLWVRLTTLAV